MNVVARLGLVVAWVTACAEPPPPRAAEPFPPPTAPSVTPQPGAPASAPPSVDAPLQAAMSTIRPEAIRAHMAFLADDALEGRGVGTRGYDIAAKYVAAQFEALGLQPGGASGSYLQAVPMRRADRVEAKCSVSLIRDSRETRLRVRDDFMPFPDGTSLHQSIDAPLVFVGFGVTAPEQGYDDYAGIDVRGKVVVMLWGAPPGFPPEIRGYYSDAFQLKPRNAAAHGATGIVAISTAPDKGAWTKMVHTFAGEPWFYSVDGSGAVGDPLPFLDLLGPDAAASLFKGAAKTLEQVNASVAKGEPTSFALPTSVRIRTAMRHTAVTSQNVIAILPGSDTTLRDEYVVLSTHIDHLGIGEPIDGDSIYNGAVDAASGVASVLTIARALTTLSPAPRRSILFLATTNEERGFTGARQFLRDPPVPLSKIIADVNIDETFDILYETKDFVPYGAEHTTLGPLLAEVGGRMGYTVGTDPIPEKGAMVRFDHFPFMQAGVPAFSILLETFHAADPSLDAKAIFSHWPYHTPKDDMSQRPLDFEAAAKGARLHLAFVHAIAQAPTRPTWNRPDFFADKFAKTSGP